jgi:hypothetical protein
MDEHQVRYVLITKNGALCGITNMLDQVKYRLAQIDAESVALGPAHRIGRAPNPTPAGCKHEQPARGVAPRYCLPAKSLNERVWRAATVAAITPRQRAKGR